MSNRIVLEIAEYRKLCASVLRRDGYKCRVCKSRNHLHCHHIIFRSQGGSDSTGNLITLCNKCHIDGVHKNHLKIKGDGDLGITITFKSTP